jgi:hypothetical protein
MPEGRLSIGNAEILALTDVEVNFPVPLRQLFPGVPSRTWASFQRRYPEAFGGPDTWRPHMGSYLVRS